MVSTNDDLITDLALSVYAQKGVYAVLLGSGMSLSAGIPTAWGVVRALIARHAAAGGQTDLEGDALDAWYRQRYGEEPSYGGLIGRETTPAGQQALLESFFEPTPEERERELKRPSPAHRALAELCASGYVKVILTTNFDRLMEQALTEAGITPSVASDPGEFAGMRPIRHEGVSIIKLHGDYKKANVRNVESALSAYPSEWDTLLDTVFDEYGLVVCGWSGEWDHALRAAILRSKGRRYPLFWSAYTAPGPLAQDLIRHRDAQVITGLGADEFFTRLNHRVQAQAHVQAPPLRTLALLDAEVKRFLSQPERYRIDLQDLLEREAQAFSAALNGALPGLPGELPAKVEIAQAALATLAALPARFIHLTATLMKYDERQRFSVTWREAVQRIQPEGAFNHSTDFNRYMRYVAVAALLHTVWTMTAAYHRFDYAQALQAWTFASRGYGEKTAILMLYGYGTDNDGFDQLQQLALGITPNRWYRGAGLRHISRQHLVPLLREAQFMEAADRGEVLATLSCLAFDHSPERFAPSGEYLYGNEADRTDLHRTHIARFLQASRERVTELLGGPEQARRAAQAFDEQMPKRREGLRGFGGQGFLTGVEEALFPRGTRA